MKQHWSTFLFAAFFVWLAYVLLFPINWDGDVWVAIRVELSDAATGKPISGAVVTLQTELRANFPNAEVRSPTILSAQTDAQGHATLKEMFPAGGDNSGTGVHVGSSVVHGAAHGYTAADVRLAGTGKLRFHKFLFYEWPHSVSLPFSLQRS